MKKWAENVVNVSIQFSLNPTRSLSLEIQILTHFVDRSLDHATHKTQASLCSLKFIEFPVLLQM